MMVKVEDATKKGERDGQGKHPVTGRPSRVQGESALWVMGGEQLTIVQVLMSPSLLLRDGPQPNTQALLRMRLPLPLRPPVSRW
jgi:hypothetical protein